MLHATRRGLVVMCGADTAPAASPMTALIGDLRHMVLPSGPSWSRWALEVSAKAMLYPRIRAVVYYRMAQYLAHKGLNPLALAATDKAIRSSGAEISPYALIGPGLCLMHSVGIVIGPEVSIGRNVRIYQGVTLGDGSRPGQPTIGDDVTIGCNAAVIGGVTIGNRVLIGANAVVTKDVPDDAVAVGIPATFRVRAKDVPSD
jgi:serine O-acetyltransferase